MANYTHPGDSFLVWFFVHSGEGRDSVGWQEADCDVGVEFSAVSGEKSLDTSSVRWRDHNMLGSTRR